MARKLGTNSKVKEEEEKEGGMEGLEHFASHEAERGLVYCRWKPN